MVPPTRSTFPKRDPETHKPIEDRLPSEEINKIGEKRIVKLDKKRHSLVQKNNKNTINCLQLQNEMKELEFCSYLNNKLLNKEISPDYETKAGVANVGKNIQVIPNLYENKSDRPSSNKKIITYNRYCQEKFQKPQEEIVNQTGLQFKTDGSFIGIPLEMLKQQAQQGDISKVESPKVSIPQSIDLKDLKTPIIIVPKGPTTLLTMLNAEDILQEYNFVTQGEKKRQGCPYKREMLIRLLVDGRLYVYRVIDDVSRLRIEDWRRVVALFVSGEDSEIKKFPWKKSKEVFESIPSFYVRYEKDSPRSKIVEWSRYGLTTITFPIFERRHDYDLVNEFWRIVRKFIRMFKPHLLHCYTPIP